MRKLTNQEFLERIKEIHGNDYILLSEYNGAKNNIEVTHMVCGSTFTTTPNNLYRGGCRTCGREVMKKRQRKTHEQFQKEVLDKGDGEYLLLGKYINSTTKIEMKHVTCGHEYLVSPRDFLSGKRCPGCRFKRVAAKNTLSHEEFCESVSWRLEEYQIMNRYKNAKTKIKIKHLACGSEYDVIPSHFKSGKNCPNCSKAKLSLKFRKQQSVFEKEVKDLREDIEILGEYINQKTKIKCRHTVCDRYFEATPDSILSGRGCPHCNESKGERKVRRYLDSLGLEYEREKTFDDCKYIQKLRFDFAVYKDEKLLFLIEYHGKQHYEPNEFFGGVKGFEETVIRDEIKRNFAKEKGIKLIEIKYNQDVNEVLRTLIPW